MKVSHGLPIHPQGDAAVQASPAFSVRRRLIAFLSVAPLMGSPGSRAQTPGRLKRVAIFLGVVRPEDGVTRFATLPWHKRRTTEMFASAGVVDGKTATLEFIATEDDSPERIEALAREVIASRPDVIFALGSDAALLFQRLTRTIPIVFSFSPDPLREGLVQSYRHPGGNLTGTSSRWYELLGKRLELIKEIRSGASKVALLMGASPVAGLAREQLSLDAPRLGLGLVDVVMRKGAVAEAESPRTMPRAEVAEALRRTRAAAFLPIDFYGLAPDLAWIQQESRIPGFFSHPGAAIGGGLAALSISEPDHLRRAGVIVGRVLRGEAPADIPVDQESSFELIVNLAAARLLGLEVPASVQLRATRVIP